MSGQTVNQPADEQAQLAKAKDYAFLLFKFRSRSDNELRARLEKKFSPLTVQRTVDFFRRQGFIDDRRFAALWIQERLNKPQGILKIKAELRAKGVDRKIIDSEINKAKQSYNEAQAVARLAASRLKTLKNVEPRLAKQRLYAYLMRRGFTYASVAEAMTQSFR